MTKSEIPQQKRNKPELLAPAGSLEAFFAAMEKGADAVYAGLKDFSARAKAKNFSLEQLERMLGYAHSLDRRIYVTLNTLVKENELPRLIEILAALEGMGADGVIVQDLAVARLARAYFPALPLHASTQMTIHNSLGVRQLEELGFERAVLARELHIDEIKGIAAGSRIGIECFIHGALCFSISGQCYFSSFLGGHSGNRGRCAQPCRRQYKYRGKEGYFFSTNDFSSIEMLPQLAEAGVASLKIEGRMKSAEYVASVVGAYRLALDAPEKRRAEAVAEAKELLKLSFGRVPTRGFLASHQPTDIATPSLKGATGRFLGEIRTIRGSAITFETKDRLHVGDRIRVQPKSDMAGRAFTVKELFAGKERVKVVRERSLVTIPAPFPFKVGDTVFKVSSETAFTMSENACLRRLEGVKGGKLPCRLTVTLAGDAMRVAATLKGGEFAMEFPLGELEPARTADMEGVLRAQFARTGDTPFELDALAAPGFPALLIPPIRLKEIRREFYQALAARMTGALRTARDQARRRALAALVGAAAPARQQRAELIVRLEQLRDCHLLHQEGIDTVSFPVSRAALHQLPAFMRKLKGREERILWRLPFIIYEADLPFYREAAAWLVREGFRRFEAANLSHFQLLKGLDVEVSTDYRLFSLNSQALLAWQELGARACTLYIEDDADNMAQLLAAELPIPRRVLVYGGVPVITTKIRIKDVKGDAPLVSDRGDGYLATVRDGLTVITPTRPFSLTGFRRRLQEMGCGSFVVDLGQLPAADWPRVLDAFARGNALEGTSEFNFQMGLV
ncbi:MAG: U32 family peptidase [Geobacteraceae bacterium]|nr:U32 family peptidase [Geobacteraceae bacterium]